MNIGDKVTAVKMASDSFYKQVRGTVTGIRNGFVEIEATEVMSKWSNEFKAHPTICRTSARTENVVAGG